MNLKVKRNLTHLFTINSLDAFLWFGFSFYFAPYLKDELGFSSWQVGWILALGSLASILLLFPVGLSADRFSPRRISVFFALGSSFSVLALAFAKSFWLVLILFPVLKTTAASLKQAMSTEALKSNKNENGFVFGWFHFCSACAVGAGMIVFGFFLQNFSFADVFLAQAMGFLVIAALTRGLSKKPSFKIEIFKNLQDLKEKRVIIFMIVFFLFAFHYGAEEASYGLFLKHNLGLSQSGMGLYMASELVFLAASALYFGLRIQKNKFDFRRALFWALFLVGSTHVLMCIPFLPWSVLMRMVHGWGDGAMNIVVFFGISRLFRIERMGGSGSAMTIAGTSGAFLGALLSMPLGAHFGYETPLIVSGLIVLFLIPLIKLLRV